MNYYKRISDSISFYMNKGYRWVDTPWIVSGEIKQMTFRGEKEKCELGYLVGSAEQGFIELMKSGTLSDGKYVSAGPCFRFDDTGKPYCDPYFFKVELCIVGSLVYEEMLYDAMEFMGGDIIPTIEGHDLTISDIEIGSYGFRNVNGLMWAYGTGLAEPRYSKALQEDKRKSKIKI